MNLLKLLLILTLTNIAAGGVIYKRLESCKSVIITQHSKKEEIVTTCEDENKKERTLICKEQFSDDYDDERNINCLFKEQWKKVNYIYVVGTIAAIITVIAFLTFAYRKSKNNKNLKDNNNNNDTKI